MSGAPALGSSKGYDPANNSSVKMWAAGATPGNEDWIAIIFLGERVDSTTYRVRYWMFRISTNDVLHDGTYTTSNILRIDNTTDVQSNTWSSGIPHAMGFEYINCTSDPGAREDGFASSHNKNGPFPEGEEDYWIWGPCESLDADVITDPYGILADSSLNMEGSKDW